MFSILNGCSNVGGGQVLLQPQGSWGGREEWKWMPKSLFNDSGAVLMFCSGPREPMSLINKLLICTMCLQHLWAGHRMMKKYVSLDRILTWNQEGHVKITLGMTDWNYYPQSNKAFTAACLFFQTSWIIKTFLNHSLAFLGVASLKIAANWEIWNFMQPLLLSAVTYIHTWAVHGAQWGITA